MESNKIKILAASIEASKDIPDNVKRQVLINIQKLNSQKMNIMITGATGCGKSSTINALFQTEKAKVGTGPTPETMEISKYELDNLIIWDSPGLGDGKDADERHKKNIINMLAQTDPDNPSKFLIDLVLVILDSSSRDLGTSYDLINEVIIPNLGTNKKDRILVALNQADAAMKGRNWDYKNNIPEPALVEFLEEKVASVKTRIFNSTGVTVEPIYYCAGFKEEGMPQEPPYNIQKLLYYIISKAPEEKRAVAYNNVNRASIEKSSQSKKEPNYRQMTGEKVKESLTSSILKGSAGGAAIGGSFAGPIGSLIGGAIGGIVGAAKNACYITTATCQSFGKQDDCYELTTLRSFRDEWLVKQPDGKSLIEQYYLTAPFIVSLINSTKDKDSVYKQLNERYILPCVSLIEENRYEDCKKLYIEMVNMLSNKYIRC